MKNNRLSIEKLLSRLPSHLSIDLTTYTKVRQKAKFIDSKYGEFWAVPYSIFAGCGHPLRGIDKRSNSKRLKIEEIIKRLPDHISIDPNTYCGSHKYASFLDKDFGSFIAIVNNVIRGGGNHKQRAVFNRKRTVLAKYGTDSTNKVKSIQDRQSISQARSTKKIKWNSGEELRCTASFEEIAVDCLNANKINYKWQPEVFKMPNGRTYRPDLYLVDQDLWVEIKGWMRPDAKIKWDWFCSQYPNSELWTAKYKDKFQKFMEAKCLILKIK